MKPFSSLEIPSDNFLFFLDFMHPVAKKIQNKPQSSSVSEQNFASLDAWRVTVGKKNILNEIVKKIVQKLVYVCVRKLIWQPP